jgi:hypothetical protein
MDHCGACNAVCHSDLVAVDCIAGECVRVGCPPALQCGISGCCTAEQECIGGICVDV